MHHDASAGLYPLLVSCFHLLASFFRLTGTGFAASRSSGRLTSRKGRIVKEMRPDGVEAGKAEIEIDLLSVIPRLGMVCLRLP
jgi:hypothetical protein